MSLDKDDVRWLMRGRQRAAVVRVLRKPMTASEICRAAHPINPHIQLRDLWFLMDELKKRRLVVCLNPRHTTGKLYALTDRGREAALCAFGLRFPPIPKGVNWRKYAQVVRARARKLVLLELACFPRNSMATATYIRKRLRDRHPMGLNPTTRAIKDLERLGLVRSAPVPDKDRCRGYTLTRSGLRIARQIRS
jgi:DNA-binding PadR family transcriptional regulator